jgi:hypothetical protein
MKKQILLSLVVISFLFSFCKKDSKTDNAGGLPDKIIVDIPSAISGTNVAKSGMQVDTGCIPISGDSIYQNVRTFIAFGKFSAQFVQDMITAIKKYELNKPMDITFTSNEDSKQKRLVVVETGQYDGKTYQMNLTTTDVESGKTAMQIFWNKDKVEGVAIIQPIYLNTTDASLTNQTKLMYKVEYSSVRTDAYDQMMIVSISGCNLTADPFSINNLKFKATKKGNVVTLIGNTNHPNAKFINPTKIGFSYAFVAKGDEAANIGAVKVALAPCILDSTDILTSYSVSNVINKELNYFITNAGANPAVDPYKTCISNILVNCQSPAYYSQNGYQSCGTTKPMMGNYDAVSVLDGLFPFSPKEVSTMAIVFGQ